MKRADAVGFAMKAGRLRSGSYAVEKLVRAGRARLALMDEAASEGTKERFSALCAANGTELISFSELGRWIGKPGHMLAAVTDEHFANMIKCASAEEKPPAANAGVMTEWQKQI